MAEVLRPYGVEVTPELHIQILSYVSLLKRWNRQISLTTVTRTVEILQFHFGESFFAAQCIPIIDGRLADVGSGAGFPGLPLRMLRPKLQLSLIESNLKKCAFLGEVIRHLDLGHVEVVRARMEECAKSLPPFDFVTARAIGQRGELLRFAGQVLSEGGKVVLWLGEKDATDMAVEEHSWRWDSPINIPRSRNRFLLVGMRI